MIAAGSHSYGYDANGNMTSRDGSTIGYTSYNLPGVINAGSNSSTLSYGAYRNRYKQTAVTAGVTETTIYIGGILEKVTRSGVTEYRHRIEGGNGTAAIYVRRSSGSPATETYFVHRDQLWSPELVTNSAGAVVVRLSFGAYGERRDSDWDGAVSSADMTAIGNTTRRGFTGHEHLDAVGLIHMNGRVYEPVIGRMLSPDAVVQIGAAQSVNCYAYVWNNPLTRTDPSGWVADNEVSPPWPLPEVPVTGQRIISALFASNMAALSLWQPSFGGDPVLRGGGGGGTKGQGQPQSQPCDTPPISKVEAGYARAGDRASFWESRLIRGDPVAQTALNIVNHHGPSASFANQKLLAEILYRSPGSSSGAIVNEARQIGVELMQAHVAAVEQFGDLSARTVAAYHFQVFDRHGVPPTAFGGTLVTGTALEAELTAHAPLIGWMDCQ
ncbi:MAG: RHS repeat-associated core domain-containing protein [Gammaproteobacteria bacterium]|nr:MAG: RHS repeat-associated core domain-containing protein [Gammaproteobacteria bacterium]